LRRLCWALRSSATSPPPSSPLVDNNSNTRCRPPPTPLVSPAAMAAVVVVAVVDASTATLGRPHRLTLQLHRPPAMAGVAFLDRPSTTPGAAPSTCGWARPYSQNSWNSGNEGRERGMRNACHRNMERRGGVHCSSSFVRCWERVPNIVVTMSGNDVFRTLEIDRATPLLFSS
jgi:hypothetical protein